MPLIKSATSTIIAATSSPTKSIQQQPAVVTMPSLAKNSNETHFIIRTKNEANVNTAANVAGPTTTNTTAVNVPKKTFCDKNDDDEDSGVNDNISGKPTSTSMMRFPSISSANKINQCFKITPSNKSLILTDKESFSIGGVNGEDYRTHKSCSTTPTSSSGLAYTPINTSSIKLPTAIFSPQFNENLATLNRKWTKFNRRSHRRRNSSSGDSKELDKLVLKSMEWDDNDIY